jgi:hypothetical protein
MKSLYTLAQLPLIPLLFLDPHLRVQHNTSAYVSILIDTEAVYNRACITEPCIPERQRQGALLYTYTYICANIYIYTYVHTHTDTDTHISVRRPCDPEHLQRSWLPRPSDRAGDVSQISVYCLELISASSGSYRCPST